MAAQSDSPARWQLLPPARLPPEFLVAVREYSPDSGGSRAAQLLWQRGMQDLGKLAGYLDPSRYQPTSPFAFGEEMTGAIARLECARANTERVAIWGDFDADGVTATSLLWEGLGEFFPGNLRHVIPNRLTDSHGLNITGIEALAAEGVTLVVTCDTGSTNIPEIERARELGIDTIVTDHHTLPAERPNVAAILNPRRLPPEHPLAHLSGVAVAYKLIEALYERLPDVPQKPLEALLDLVAIGAIADLVELKGDCRYLVQRGIEQLKQQSNPQTATRPGVCKLLELCGRTGDRPTDISFGLGPRINAISRIHGDATFAVELLTGTDAKRASELALATELANARRKGLQNDLVKAVRDRVARLDLSTTGAIVLEDPQWPGGILGLVAGQIAQEYARPTILLSGDPTTGLAAGSARSVNNIDLYSLVKSQEHLLHRFGGHPFAAGLSLPLENISLFRDGLDRQLQQLGEPAIVADLAVTAGELGRDLFRELKLLEPYGTGNPVPKLLIENCWFENVCQGNIKDRRGGRVKYIKTAFSLCDDTHLEGTPGCWWGHYSNELPQAGRCDAIVELDYNSRTRAHEVRLVAVRPRCQIIITTAPRASELLDWRGSGSGTSFKTDGNHQDLAVLSLREPPRSWRELQAAYQHARTQQRPLALAYSLPAEMPPEAIWSQLVGIAKHLSRTGRSVSGDRLRSRLGIGERVLDLGLVALKSVGFWPLAGPDCIQIGGSAHETADEKAAEAISRFLAAIAEEQFQCRYFCQAPIDALIVAIEILERSPAIIASEGMPCPLQQ